MPSKILALLLVAVFASTVLATAESLTCEDVRQAVDKCQFVRQYCQDDRLGYFDYTQVYYCAASPIAGAFFLSTVVLWLAVLFTVIGVAASDYLCPNLNTISKMLGLSESLAGVTFLALGNGSPDVFSTYAAMKIGSGSLAIGELVGAACFITAVVTGAMAIIRPFKVARKSFLRDAVFFTVAVAFSLYCISDGVLKTWECVTMLVIYVVYVLFVVAWHWYNARRRRLYLVETRARDFYTELGHEVNIEADEEIVDDPSLLTQNFNFAGFGSPSVSPRTAGPLLHDTSLSPLSPLSALPVWHEQSEEEQEEAYNELTRIMRIRRLQQRTPNLRLDTHFNTDSLSPGPSTRASIRPSLFGAMEFRGVLEQLGRARTASGVSIQLQNTLSSDAVEPRQATSHPHLELPRDDARARANSAPAISFDANRSVPHVIVTNVHNEVYEPVGYTSADYERATSPNLDRYTDDPNDTFLTHDSNSSVASPQHTNYPNREGFSKVRERITKTFGEWGYILITLCPSLQGIRSKSWINWIMCIVTAPAILFLTVTVPVIESEAIEKETIQTSEEDPQYFFAPEKTKVYISMTRWLLTIQAILGPLFVSWSGFADSDTSLIALTVYAFTVSAAMLLLIFFLVPEANRAPLYMQGLAFVGFVIAISWVSLVANEVVGVLKSLGLIFHISDAVLGLTVFAVGNSLGDLVANMTVARMGFPMMALSACFGGPMLNILVGVGVSGLLVMPVGDGYHVELSNTLVISSVTLLVTLVFLLIAVPLNDWRLSRTLGTITVLFWAIATGVNVILEIATK